MSMQFKDYDLFVSPNGDDTWSGFLQEPNKDKTEGPLASIDEARKRVRELRQRGLLNGPVTVWIRGGRYLLSQPIQFGPLDAGPTNYAAYPGEKPVFEGATQITDWKEEKLNGKKVWVADVSVHLHEKGYFRSFFVNGERRPRSRWPKSGWLIVEDDPHIAYKTGREDGSDAFIAKKGDFSNWTNLEDLEVVATHYWIEERMPVIGYDPETRIVRLSRRSVFTLKDVSNPCGSRYFVENVFEALSDPGEWYLNRKQGKLYYIPMHGEKLGEIETVVPHLLQFVRVIGDIENGQLIHGLRFEGLSFEYTDWQQPDGWGKWYDPYTPSETWRIRDSFRLFTENDMKNKSHKTGTNFASVPQGAFNLPAVIFMEGAKNCAVQDCCIAHIGWYGIELGEACTGNRIIGNTITDMGGGGIKLDGSDADGDYERRNARNRITDNHIYAGGRIFFSAIGIMLVYSGRNVIAHNEIHDLYYSGISVGWHWDYKESFSSENQILKNHIYHLGQKILSDIGGIYTLGVQPGTVIRGNLIHDIEKQDYGADGIYLDEASSCILVENNIVYNTASRGLLEHWGRQNIYRNNIFAFGGECGVFLCRENDYNWIDWSERGCNFERNIVITSGKIMFHDTSKYLDSGYLFSDLNLFWDYDNQEPVVWNYCLPGKEPKKYTLEELRVFGLDRHSIVADPKFKNPRQGDFTLDKDSPAHDLGFRPIDMSDVGVRAREKRKKEAKHSE